LANGFAGAGAQAARYRKERAPACFIGTELVPALPYEDSASSILICSLVSQYSIHIMPAK
jgi:hypothetical protein